MTALLFPGQGTQRIGMGQMLARSFPEQVMPLIQEAAALCDDLPETLRRGPTEKLSQTSYAQLAVTTVNLGALAVLRSHGVGFDVVAGHSVGLISALVAAGCLDAPVALRLAHARGALMGALPGGGAMVSLNGASADAAADIARQASLGCETPVVVALVNGPETVVLSGGRVAAERAVSYGTERGVKAAWLAVSHAFHSPLMAPAHEEWRAMVAALDLRPAHIPIVADESGELLTSAAAIGAHLTDQLTTPVRWDLVCERLLVMGQMHCVEAGDSKTLRALARPYPELVVESMAMGPTLAHVRDHGRLPERLVRPERRVA